MQSLEMGQSVWLDDYHAYRFTMAELEANIVTQSSCGTHLLPRADPLN